MHPLDLKLIRDLGNMKGQSTAVALVMACGLAVMIMARSLVVSLESARDAYYTGCRFADVFCDLKRAPNALRARLAEIPGVAALETRVTGSVILDLPGLKEPANGNILSIPEDRPQQLNLIFLRTGRLPEPGSDNEVVVGEAFAEAHGFSPGNTIDATIHGARQTLRIVGIGLSPEYVYESRPGESVPDSRRFGVFWMNERALATALTLNGAFNSVAARLAPRADRRAVMAEMDQILGPYGGLIAYDRTDHLSAKQIDDRVRVLGAFSVAFPAVFLSIAAFMTSAVLTRLIRLQREQIAQLKAFGYSSGQVGWHYLKFALVIVTIATILGGLLGLWMGHGVVIVYRRFFHFPSLPFQTDWTAILLAFAASSAASLLGVSGAVWQAMKLPAAEAMRPEPPAEFRPSVLERLGLQWLVSPAFRMALRNLERKPWHAFFTALGLAFATGIPIVPGAVRDGIAYLIDFQWDLAQRQDVTLGLIEPGSASALNDLHHLPGVLSAEPFRSVAARLRHEHRERRVAVTGLPQGARLNRLLDQAGKPVALPPSGLLLSAKLAEVLGAAAGDTVHVEIQESTRPEFNAVVAGTITDFAGVGAYIDIDALRRLMREGGTVSGAHLAVDPAQWGELLAQAKKSPRIGTFTITRDARSTFDKTTGEMMGTVQAIYFGFAIIVAFGVVYNGARIALSERSRDLATLRVVGLTHREVATVLIGELALLTLFAIPPGLFIGSQLAGLIVRASSTESVRLPLVLTARTYATAALIVLVSSGLSFAVVSRRIHRLDLLGVLKARE
ncbi:MAG: FtsX-like permease family protein [Verrucomicrobia bacterium]|nr:FtsX-like permease family protein [Verrucomicrobiota bacterium]